MLFSCFLSFLLFFLLTIIHNSFLRNNSQHKALTTLKEATGPWHEWTEHQGCLGKGLSAPEIPAVFGPFMPGTCRRPSKLEHSDSPTQHNSSTQHLLNHKSS